MLDNKKGVGRNKTRAKQREYKEHCRVMRTSGMVTNERGAWTEWDKNPMGISEASFRGTTAK
jgi:hypothetical protein